MECAERKEKTEDLKEREERMVIHCPSPIYNTIQLYNTTVFYTAPSIQSTTVLESAMRESLLLQQSTFVPQHSVDVVSYFHSVWASAALLNAHPKNSHGQVKPSDRIVIW